MSRTCNQAEDSRCQGATNKFCFGCGLPVCERCSLKRDWYLWKNKRICLSCHREEARER